MNNELIANEVKRFREFIMFKYKSENTAKNYGSAVALFLSKFDVPRPKDINIESPLEQLVRERSPEKLLIK